MESEIIEEPQIEEKGERYQDDEVQGGNFSMEDVSEMQKEKEVIMGLDEWWPKHIRKPTWKVQEQMQAKWAARTRNAIRWAHGAKPAYLGTGQEACPGYTSSKKNNELCTFFLDNGARDVNLVFAFFFPKKTLAPVS